MWLRKPVLDTVSAIDAVESARIGVRRATLEAGKVYA